MDKFSNKPFRATIALLACLLIAAVASPQRYAAARQPQASGAGQHAGPLAPVGSGFTYQGQLKSGGNPANGQYDFQFRLYDALSGGTQVGSTLTVSNQTVTNGLFTVPLDFGASAFGGSARWLEIAVRPTGGGTYTTLSPRQPLTATPYAQSLMPGAMINTNLPTPALVITNTDTGFGSIGIYATGANYGVYGNSINRGVFGSAPSFGTGVWGQSGSGEGVYGYSSTGNAVRGLSSTGHGGYFVTNGSAGHYGVWGQSYQVGGIGVYGTSPGTGVYGYSESGTGTGTVGYSNGVANGQGVYGLASGTDAIGVHGVSNNGSLPAGVKGESTNGIGVWGESANSVGVSGFADNGGVGVIGSGSNGGKGVAADASGANSIAIYASGGQWAGYFEGNVNVTGSCCAAAEGSFKIDDPTDPANKYLTQSAVQSSDMLGIDRGHVTLDAKGEAWVEMPSWFRALYGDFDYQLTCIGSYAPVYISQELQNNRFQIAGGNPGLKVSWQITGIRHDPYAKQHPIQPEVEKSGEEKGTYLHPELYGQPDSKGLGYEDRQRLHQLSSKPEAPKP